MERSGENLPMTLGRLLLLVDYHSKSEPRFYYHDQIDEIVQWTRYDLTYSELLEFAKLGSIEGRRFILRLPPRWLNANRHIAAGKLRAGSGTRNEKGRFVKVLFDTKKPIKLDSEGNEIV